MLFLLTFLLGIYVFESFNVNNIKSTVKNNSTKLNATVQEDMLMIDIDIKRIPKFARNQLILIIPFLDEAHLENIELDKDQLELIKNNGEVLEFIVLDNSKSGYDINLKVQDINHINPDEVIAVMKTEPIGIFKVQTFVTD